MASASALSNETSHETSMFWGQDQRRNRGLPLVNSASGRPEVFTPSPELLVRCGSSVDRRESCLRSDARAEDHDGAYFNRSALSGAHGWGSVAGRQRGERAVVRRGRGGGGWDVRTSDGVARGRDLCGDGRTNARQCRWRRRGCTGRRRGRRRIAVRGGRRRDEPGRAAVVDGDGVASRGRGLWTAATIFNPNAVLRPDLPFSSTPLPTCLLP